MIFAVLLAGGSGTRMKNAKIPKQFLELNGEPIIKLTIDKFMASPLIDHVVVAVPQIWLSHTKDILKNFDYTNLSLCEGGSNRQASLYNAIKFIEKNFAISDDDIIISHDIVRPFVTLRIIEENIKKLDKYDAIDTVIPATDTIVESQDSCSVFSIPDRSKMYQGQTPQTFKLKTFISIYESLSNDYLEKVTDAARILSENGVKVGLVYGEEFNIKITTEYDFRIAKFLLESLNDKTNN